jgi:nucleotide-binding universal stress UspA family protein
VTVGPHSPIEAVVESAETVRPFLFATDFSEPSLRALPYAVSFANQRRTKLALLHMLSPVPHLDGNAWYTASDVERMRRGAQLTTRKHLEELTARADLAVEPAFLAEFGEPADGILRTAGALHAEVIVMGLKSRTHVDTLSHLPWSSAYRVVCGAACPVLTVRD